MKLMGREWKQIRMDKSLGSSEPLLGKKRMLFLMMPDFSVHLDNLKLNVC